MSNYEPLFIQTSCHPIKRIRLRTRLYCQFYKEQQLISREDLSNYEPLSTVMKSATFSFFNWYITTGWKLRKQRTGDFVSTEDND